MNDAKTSFENVRQAFLSRETGRAIGRGLPVGDFLEAHRWELLREEPGKIRLGIHMPAHVRNAMGQLFGGFTPTYVDLIAILTCRAARAESENINWIVTKSMQVEYIEPVMDGFFVESEVIRKRGRHYWVMTRFLDAADKLVVLANTTLQDAA